MEYKQLVEQIDQRQERLSRLAEHRQEYEQSVSRLVRWFDEQQHFLSTDPTIPLKITDLERLLKKSQVRTAIDPLHSVHITNVCRKLWTNCSLTGRFSIISLNWTNEFNKDSLSKLFQTAIFILKVSQFLSSPSFLVHRRHLELWTKFHHLEEKLIHRQEQLVLGNEHRQSFEQVLTRLTDWMKSNEQQLRDPPINDLQEITSVLHEKHQLIQSLFGSAKDQLSEFDDLTRLHAILSSNVNETDRLIVDERYSLLKDRYNRLLDTLTQRLTFLDQSIRQSFSLFSLSLVNLFSFV